MHHCNHWHTDFLLIRYNIFATSYLCILFRSKNEDSHTLYKMSIEYIGLLLENFEIKWKKLPIDVFLNFLYQIKEPEMLFLPGRYNLMSENSLN